MLIPLSPLVLVYLAFTAKHLLGDFVLQTGWMANGKNMAKGWLAPLAAHAGIHAGGTLLIALAAAPSLWWLALVDFVVHAGIDRAKAVVARGLTFQHARFWWAFGLDQAAHQVTHFVFVLVIVTRA